jgi:hypothetical protein
MNNRRVSETKRISLSGILLAFAVISLFLATIVPTNTLSFYALSSFFVAIIIIQFGIKSGWIFYIASSLLSLILLPDKAGLIPYLAFFGLYGIIKFYIEKLNKIVLEYILKLGFFNFALLIAIFLVKQFFLDRINIDFPWWIIIFALEIAFIAYDYVYTLFIQFYNTKLKRKLGM